MLQQSVRSEHHRAARLAAYQAVLIEAWRRKAISNTEVATAIGRCTSLVSKLRTGRVPICSRVGNHLIDLLEMDRTRLFLAVEVAGDGRLYFDPAFRNACYATTGFLNTILGELAEHNGQERRGVFAAFSQEVLETVAGEAGRDVAEQFVTLAPKVRRRCAG